MKTNELLSIFSNGNNNSSNPNSRLYCPAGKDGIRSTDLDWISTQTGNQSERSPSIKQIVIFIATVFLGGNAVAILKQMEQLRSQIDITLLVLCLINLFTFPLFVDAWVNMGTFPLDAFVFVNSLGFVAPVAFGVMGRISKMVKN